MRARHPRIFRNEISYRARYPNRVETPAGLVRYRRSRWEHLNSDRDEPRIRPRDAAAWLYDGADRIGLLTLTEYDLDPGVYWEEFFYWADGFEQQAGDAVLAMQEGWGDDFVSPSDYGSIVFLAGAWIAPAYRTRLDQRAALDAALEAIAPEHAVALLLAYPAGFDEDPADPDAQEIEGLGDFDWRQRALMRMYEWALGFERLIVRDARPDFMWRPRPDLADVIRRMISDR